MPAQTVPVGGASLASVADVALNGGFHAVTFNGGPIGVRTIVPATGQTLSQAARFDGQNPGGVFYRSDTVGACHAPACGGFAGWASCVPDAVWPRPILRFRAGSDSR